MKTSNISALEYHSGMRKHFPGIGNAGRFLDTLAIQCGKRVALDIMAFDEWLHGRHGEYENDGLSMADCIAKHYGEPARKFVESLI